MKKLIYLITVAFLCAMPIRAVETTPDPKKDTRSLAYEQQRVRERYSALEKKMEELAEMLKEKEPASAAKLTAALKTAREDLVTANMQAIVQALQESKLPEAANQSAKVVEELRKLLAILSESERTLDSLQKELDRLQAQLAALQEIIKQETAHQGASAEVARTQEQIEKLKNEKPDAKRTLEVLEKERKDLEQKLAQAKYDAMKQGQQSTRILSEKLSDTLKQTNNENSPASQQPVGDSSKQLDGAAGDMKNAEQNLGDKNAPDAAQNQQAALDKLKAAEQKMQEAISAAQTQQLIQIETVLREMLEKQKVYSGDTISLDQKLAKATRAREDELKSKEMSDGEAKLSEQAQLLIGKLKEEATTAVFPAVLGETRDDLKWTATQLETVATGKPTQVRQRQIEENLAELIDALKKERIRRQVMVAGGGGGGG